MDKSTVSPSDRSLIESSDLFDAGWYADAYVDVRHGVSDPAGHYLRIGARLGRHPSMKFDAKAYEQTYPDAIWFSGGALLHYLKVGRKNGCKISPVTHFLPPVQAQTGRTAAWHIDQRLRDAISAAMAIETAPKFKEAAALIAAEFDPEFYVLKNPEVLYAGLNPIQNYLEVGANRGRDPSPHFSTRTYKARAAKDLNNTSDNPFAYWIQKGRQMGQIGDPAHKFPHIARRLGLEPAAAAHLMAARRGNLLERLKYGKLGELVAKAAELDPLVAASWPDAMSPKMPPFHTTRTGDKMISLIALRAAAKHSRAKFVIAVNRPRWGSGLKEEGYLAKFLAEKYGPEQVLVIYTDTNDDIVPGRFDDAIRQVSLKAAVRGAAEDVTIDVLLTFLRSLRPTAVFNINSQFTWLCQMTYRALLSRETKLYNYMFCNEKNYFGAWVGYPVKYTYRCFDWCEGLIVDSHYLKDELVERFALPAPMRDRIHVISAPADNTVALAAPSAAPGRAPQVFWSGRFDRQKRPDLLARIAAQMPDVTFRVWGKAVLGRFDASELALPNVVLEGVYQDFSELPLKECDAWLYTSEWDGVPHLLLEVCMTGVPLVGSVAGGTAEVLRDGLSWPVADVEDVGAYVAALREILDNPEAARKRARALRDAMARERDNRELRALVDSFAPAAAAEGAGSDD